MDSAMVKSDQLEEIHSDSMNTEQNNISSEKSYYFFLQSF